MLVRGRQGSHDVVRFRLQGLQVSGSKESNGRAHLPRNTLAASLVVRRSMSIGNRECLLYTSPLLWHNLAHLVRMVLDLSRPWLLPQCSGSH